MQCEYYSAGLCQSCSQIDVTYPEQLSKKQQNLTSLLAPFSPTNIISPLASLPQGFLNKAKMVVQGTSEHPILGIINHQKQAVDLVNCPLYPTAFKAAFEQVKAFISFAKLEPYSIETRRGELKFVLLTYNPTEQTWLLRLVLRSKNHLDKIRKCLPWLQIQWPELQVCSVNLQPEHKAILEGETEIILTAETMLSQQLNHVPLYIQPQSFFQTNNTVAAKLYQTAKDWSESLEVSNCWDLFCGVGGFALHLASRDLKVTGIEISASAIDCATRSASEMGISDFTFQALDSTAFAMAQNQPPELLVVNPPRRGLGQQLCGSINQLQPAWLIYSSCNPATLVADLRLLEQYQLEKAQLFDMFPHSHHSEVLTLLKRTAG
ncbi:23S rRNA (uracil(747)-C(5))-methyltransferase RlmC [Motilimonas cestriensis]|uniref:23S rRNA (uracil(747)-C(5))-methyltransferase RlmC n=1 Tax=Motilimonas cestriensis TaxID=2742685 RepID=UPI003DA3F038